jgi:hypothetical protein
MTDDRVRDYRERATRLLAPYRSKNVQEIVARDLLPALFADAPR